MARRARTTRRRIGLVTAALAVVLAVLVTWWATATPSSGTSTGRSCSPGTTVQTAKGAVCGRTAHGVTSYDGIPYAAPPVGSLRWRPPAPHAPWTTTMRATSPVKGCPSPGWPAGTSTPGTNEDCLYLEIQVPAGAQPGDALPVMYEIHGGGFIGGVGTGSGVNLVRAGHVIYVFVAYRLGILGFLADSALGGHSGDYGLQDQQAGLRWVQQNISRFGGDPHNVTIFGGSAGGASVCAQVASPTAKGLFQKGISVSGFYNYQRANLWATADCKSTYETEAQAQGAGARFAKKVGCGGRGHVAACLRSVPVDRLVAAGGQLLDPKAGGTIGPIVNGTTLTMSPAQAFATGHVNHVSLITDVGRDEFNGAFYRNRPHIRTVVAETPGQYHQLLREHFGAAATAVEARYPLSRYASPFVAYRTVMADSASVCPMLRADRLLSRQIPVYADIDDDGDIPAAESPQHPLGALHAGTTHLVHLASAGLSPDQAVLQDQLLAEWTHFARTGTPTAPHTPAWPRYAGTHPSVMALRSGGASSLAPAASIAARHHCRFWGQVTQY